MIAPKQKGFTIIELLVYLGLFAILIGGALVGVYQIIESTNGNQAYVVIEQEGQFLVRKIGWSLNGATAINSPLPGVPGTSLSVSSPDGSSAIAYSGNILSLSQNGSPSQPLNSQNISVENLNIQNLAGAGIKVDFDLTSQDKTRHFTMTKYLR